MPQVWQQDAERVWTLRGDEGEILAGVTQVGPYLGQNEPVYRTSGPLIDQAVDFATLAEAQTAVERVRDQQFGA